MFGILLLLAAAFSGHEVASSAADPSVPQAAAVAPAATEVPAGSALTIRVADTVLQPAATDPARPAGDDNDIKSALDRVSDFYDTTPPAPPVKAQRAVAAPVAQAQAPIRPALGPHLVSQRTDYVSGGRPVVVEIVRPDDDERRPAVLILHGASGIGDGAFYRSAAEMFAEHGYVTFLPHYLEAARAKPSKAHTKTAASSRTHAEEVPGSIRAGFPQQEQILRDAVDYAAHSPYVDSSRIGVFGLSLGGFHALTLSSRDGRIAAVVDMSGALRGNALPETNHLAPTLELHGANDPIVPVSRARALAGTLKQLGVPYELKIYPTQGHFLRGKAQEDAMERAASFFGTYLTPTDTSRAAQQSGGGAE